MSTNDYQPLGFPGFLRVWMGFRVPYKKSCSACALVSKNVKPRKPWSGVIPGVGSRNVAYFGPQFANCGRPHATRGELWQWRLRLYPTKFEFVCHIGGFIVPQLRYNGVKPMPQLAKCGCGIY